MSIALLASPSPVTCADPPRDRRYTPVVHRELAAWSRVTEHPLFPLACQLSRRRAELADSDPAGAARIDRRFGDVCRLMVAETFPREVRS